MNGDSTVHSTFIVHGQVAWTMHTALFLTSDTPLSLFVDILPGLYIQHYFLIQIYHFHCPWTYCVLTHTALFLTSDIPLSLSMDILPGLYIQHYFLIQIDILPIDTYSIIFDFRHTTFIVHGHIAWTIHTTLFLTSDIPLSLSMDILPGLYIQHYF